jgi:hypothetical protein
MEIKKRIIRLLLTIISLHCLFIAGCTHWQTAGENDAITFKMCLEVCNNRYRDNQGTKHYRKIKANLIACTCITARGDETIYFNMESSEHVGDIQVEVEKDS